MLYRTSARLCNLSKQVTGKEPTAKLVQVEYFKNFAKVTLNSPKTLNSLNMQMISEINAELKSLDGVSAFWIEGAGGKAFCAGGDVKTLYENRYTNRRILADFFREEFTLDYKLTNLKAMQISNLDGIVMGGGVGLSIFSPFRIATENTLFAMPENKIGFFTDVCGGYFLSRLRNNIGYYLGLTGARLKGYEVYKAGIANYFIPRASLGDAFNDLKKELAETKDPKSTIEQVLKKYSKPSANTKLYNEDDINEIFNSKTIEEVLEKLKTEKNPFYGKVKKALDEQCPLSTHVTFRSIKYSRNKSMKDCFVTDYGISQRFMEGTDFFEGVRCALVDKGAKPKWKHAKLYDVKKYYVDKYFQPLDSKYSLKL